MEEPKKPLSNLQLPVTKGLKTDFRRRRRRRRRRRLIGGTGSKDMKVARLAHTNPTHQSPPTFGGICPYSN
jgi:hypothetical protein